MLANSGGDTMTVNDSPVIFCVCPLLRLTPDFLLRVFKIINLLNGGGKRRVPASTGTNSTMAVHVSAVIFSKHQ